MHFHKKKLKNTTKHKKTTNHKSEREIQYLKGVCFFVREREREKRERKEWGLCEVKRKQGN
jgi:hypothetical protein